MVDGNKYVELVKECFSFLVVEFGFELFETKIRGSMFYDVQYRDKTKIVSVSYENIEDYLGVVVFILQNGHIPDYDDKTKTLHLDKMFASLRLKFDHTEIRIDDEYFSGIQTGNTFEKKILQSARQLRFCLKHFDEV